MDSGGTSETKRLHAILFAFFDFLFAFFDFLVKPTIQVVLYHLVKRLSLLVVLVFPRLLVGTRGAWFGVQDRPQR